MKAVVIGGANITDYRFVKKMIAGANLIVCCDGGVSHARKMELSPNYIVGDFDSAPKEDLDFFREMKVPMEQFPTEKDETDLQIGISLCIEKGVDDLVILGGIGSRFDHTFANVQLLLGLLKKGISAKLVNEYNVIELIDQPTTLTGEVGELLSTLPLSDCVEGLTLKGVQYPLNNRDLYLDDPLVAVSNVFAEKTIEISFRSGYLLIIRASDKIFT
ncbi:MAG: thiamine diphosphokinase [Bacillota bacterium]